MGANKLVRLTMSQNNQVINSYQLDQLVGMAMLIVASTVFSYYTVWTLLMV